MLYSQHSTIAFVEQNVTDPQNIEKQCYHEEPRKYWKSGDQNILMIQEVNRKIYDRKGKKARDCHNDKQVAIQHLQFGTKLKRRPTFYVQYREKGNAGLK